MTVSKLKIIDKKNMFFKIMFSKLFSKVVTVPIGDTEGWPVGFTCNIIVSLELNTGPARSVGGMQT